MGNNRTRMCFPSLRACFSQPRSKKRRSSSKRNSRTKRSSNNRIRVSHTSRSSIHSTNHMTLDDVIDQRISELGLPGLDQRKSKQSPLFSPRPSQQRVSMTTTQQQHEQQQERAPQRQDRLSQKHEELKAIKESRKMARNTLTRGPLDRNSILEDVVLEDLCGTTGLEARHSTMRSKERLELLDKLNRKIELTLEGEELTIEASRRSDLLDSHSMCQRERKRQKLKDLMCCI